MMQIGNLHETWNHKFGLKPDPAFELFAIGDYAAMCHRRRDPLIECGGPQRHFSAVVITDKANKTAVNLVACFEIIDPAANIPQEFFEQCFTAQQSQHQLVKSVSRIIEIAITIWRAAFTIANRIRREYDVATLHKIKANGVILVA